MTDLINFKENLKDSITNSLLDYINYMHETKQNETSSDALAKCVLMSGELFANKIKKGEASQDDIEAVVGKKIAKNIINATTGNAKVHSGGGGVYGKVEL